MEGRQWRGIYTTGGRPGWVAGKRGWIAGQGLAAIQERRGAMATPGSATISLTVSPPCAPAFSIGLLRRKRHLPPPANDSDRPDRRSSPAPAGRVSSSFRSASSSQNRKGITSGLHLIFPGAVYLCSSISRKLAIQGEAGAEMMASVGERAEKAGRAHQLPPLILLKCECKLKECKGVVPFARCRSMLIHFIES